MCLRLVRSDEARMWQILRCRLKPWLARRTSSASLGGRVVPSVRRRVHEDNIQIILIDAFDASFDTKSAFWSNFVALLSSSSAASACFGALYAHHIDK